MTGAELAGDMFARLRLWGRRASVSPVTMVLRWLHTRVIPGFVAGMGSVLDVGGVTGPEIDLSRDPFAEDQRALGSDWRRVGDDLRRAVATLRPTEAEPR